jgi:hypothetical protein
MLCLIEFSVYCVFIPELMFAALTSLWIAIILSIVIVGITWKLHGVRMLHWGKSPLDFEERAPSVVEPLDLETAAFLSR